MKKKNILLVFDQNFFNIYYLLNCQKIFYLFIFLIEVSLLPTNTQLPFTAQKTSNNTAVQLQDHRLLLSSYVDHQTNFHFFCRQIIWESRKKTEKREINLSYNTFLLLSNVWINFSDDQLFSARLYRHLFVLLLKQKRKTRF